MRAQVMESESRDRSEGKVNESRAAALLGLSTQKLRRLSAESGLGQLDQESGGTQLIFTYAELYRLCRLAADNGS
jgi:hypothetical protein